MAIPIPNVLSTLVDEDRACERADYIFILDVLQRTVIVELAQL
jgi:hypothetical protein